MVAAQHMRVQDARRRAAADGQLEAAQRVHRERLADGGERLAGRQRAGDRREDVAAVEGARTRAPGARGERPMSTASTTPPSRSRGGHQQPVVGPDQEPLLAGRAQRDRAARAAPDGADAGIDDGEVHARRAGRGARRAASSAPVRTSWRGIAWVRSITRALGQRRAITPWQTPTNSSRWP